MKLKIKKLHPDAVIPQYMTDGAVGLDLFYHDEWGANAALSRGLGVNGHIETLGTGISVAIPRGYEGQIRPRSGLAAKHGVTVLNAPGTIDSDYREEVKVCLINHSDAYFIVEHGMRIAQLVIAPVKRCELVEVDELDETERGAGGFGSTDIQCEKCDGSGIKLVCDIYGVPGSMRHATCDCVYSDKMHVPHGGSDE